MKTLTRHQLIPILLFTLPYGAAAQLLLTWDGGGAPSPNFSTAANWAGDTAPTNAATFLFDGTVNLAPFNDLAVLTGPSNSVIHFMPTAGAFTLGGSPIQGGNVTNNSPVAQTINLQLRLDAARTIDTGGGESSSVCPPHPRLPPARRACGPRRGPARWRCAATRRAPE